MLCAALSGTALLGAPLIVQAASDANTHASEVLARKKQYLTQQLSQADQPLPAPDKLWLTKTLSQQFKQLFHRKYHRLSIRYWQNEKGIVLFLEAIGKHRFITAGFHLHQGQILDTTIIAYREDWGGEIRQTGFLEQFTELTLDQNNNVSADIDGISGATLSVNAMRGMAKAALLLEQEL